MSASRIVYDERQLVANVTSYPARLERLATGNKCEAVNEHDLRLKAGVLFFAGNTAVSVQ